MKALLEALFKQYQKDVYLYLFSLCRDSALAEELTADTFLQAVQSISRYRGAASEKTWLFSIARHRWYNWLRKQKQVPQPDPTALLLTDSPEDLVCSRELAQRVRELLAQQPERAKQVAELRLQGLSFWEIGQALQITENSARVLFFRVRTRIRETLQKEGYTDG